MSYTGWHKPGGIKITLLDCMEGPSLVILRQEMKRFVQKTVMHAEGNWSGGAEQFTGEKFRWIKTWGKHLLVRIGDVTLRVHFLLWGSYTIDRRKDRSATLSLQFESGELHFYSSSIKQLEEPIQSLYDWRVDVMSRKWDAKYVRALVRSYPKEAVADILLDQNIFAGVGNIIKNEVLFRLKLYPLTKVSTLKPKQIAALVEEAHRYSHQFYRWKKRYVLKKHYRIYHKGTCPECHTELIAKKLGIRERYTYYCPACQAA
jgi:endonuclease VIII